MCYDFSTTTAGKWILAGEHAVLRGHPAIVFPLKSLQLTLHYRATSTPLRLTYHDAHNQRLESIIWGVIEEGLTLLNLSRESTALNGFLHIENQIPLGAGLGASAALCVAIARWLQAYFAPTLELLSFAKLLEHLFHGQSSGLDVAAAASTHGIFFQQGQCTPIPLQWSPHWRLSSSGEIGLTSRAIEQVQQLRQNEATRADEIDACMARSVELAHHALLQQENTTLAEAIRRAHACFEAWGLVTPTLNAHMQQLQNAGALAVKPTGSGGGGHVLSLWAEAPTAVKLTTPLLTL